MNIEKEPKSYIPAINIAQKKSKTLTNAFGLSPERRMLNNYLRKQPKNGFYLTKTFDLRHAKPKPFSKCYKQAKLRLKFHELFGSERPNIRKSAQLCRSSNNNHRSKKRNRRQRKSLNFISGSNKLKVKLSELLRNSKRSKSK